MSSGVLLAFVATCIVLGLTPGPNMSLIIANTMAGGLKAGLFTLAGTTSGLAVLVAVTALGMTSVMAFTTQWFDVIRAVGALYLCFLGFQQLRQAWRSKRPLASIESKRASRYAQGLIVSLSNPKVLLFLGAFLPQFVEPGWPAGPQLLILSLVFVATLAFVDLTYIVALARTRAFMTDGHMRLLDAVAGTMLLAGGLFLAVLRQP